MLLLLVAPLELPRPIERLHLFEAEGILEGQVDASCEDDQERALAEVVTGRGLDDLVEEIHGRLTIEEVGGSSRGANHCRALQRGRIN